MKILKLFLSLVALFAVSCTRSGLENPQVPNVKTTPCKQDVLRSSELSDKVNVEFTDKGVEITYYNFEVTCDFTTVNVTHTLVNGVLNITQQGFPNQAKCICYTDVSYTISGISQNEVNVIFINGVQVYCHNDMNNSCEFENPLTDLPWLKAKVDEITLLFQENPLHIAIYQCTYGDGQTGFLEDRGNVVFVYNCEGETLCIMGGFAGETCSELNIVSKKLIWEINN